MKKKVEDYFTGATTAPYDTAPAGETLSWNPQVSPEAALERQALVFGLDNRPPQVVPQAGKEPAATPVEYAPIPETNLYPAAGTKRETPLMTITRGAGQEPDPVFAGLTGPTTRPNYAPQAAAANVLRDSAGNPVISGNGTPIGIPNQTVGNTASGGKGGANYQSGDALKQITGGK